MQLFDVFRNLSVVLSGRTKLSFSATLILIFYSTTLSLFPSSSRIHVQLHDTSSTSCPPSRAVAAGSLAQTPVAVAAPSSSSFSPFSAALTIPSFPLSFPLSAASASHPCFVSSYHHLFRRSSLPRALSFRSSMQHWTALYFPLRDSLFSAGFSPRCWCFAGRRESDSWLR